MRGNGHRNFRGDGRSSRDQITEMRIERFDIGSRADGSQVHRNAACTRRKFFGSGHELATRAFSLLLWIDAQQAEIHAVGSLFKVDAADEFIGQLEQQEPPGAEIVQRAFVVDAIAADERALDFKRGVDQSRERAGVGMIGEAKRRRSSCRVSGKNGAAGEFCGGAEFFFDAKKLVVFGYAVGTGGGTGFDLARAGGDG